MNSYSEKFDLKNSEELKNKMQKSGFAFEPFNHALWRAKGKNVAVTLYNSGKILVQGNGTQAFLTDFLYISNQLNLLAPPATVKNEMSKDQTNSKQPDPLPRIGTDESGKGDYFGPLVVASVLIDENNEKIFKEAGIRDSKTITDATIEKLAAKIKAHSIFTVIVINPQKYNELYGKFNNLNKLLAWGHARAIENILEKTACNYAISDKFGDESLIKNALMKKGQTIELHQRVRAESDIAVAAASILARNEFVQRMKKLSQEYGMTFPKGAGDKVIEQGKIFVSKHSAKGLENVAKTHFKTTQVLENKF